MIKIKAFPFNPFAMNTYVLWDETGEGIIIDSGNYTNEENAVLLEFINSNRIVIKSLWLTHAHIDHITGAKYLSEYFGLPVHSHPAGDFLFNNAAEYAASLGMDFKGIPENIKPIEVRKSLVFGNSKGKLLYTPGHVDGSVCYYFPDDKILISGDVLFYRGIGRTDLPTGDYHTLEKSIRNQLYTLPDDVVVFPGHGPKTSIGFEKRNNPFVQD